MNVVLEVVLPVFGLILAGWTFQKGGWLPEGGAKALGVFVFYLAIPALLFRSMARGLPELDAASGLYGAYFGGVAAMYLLAWLIGRGVFGLGAQDRTMMGMGAGFSNIVIIGLPLIGLAYGDAGLVPTVLIIAIHSPLLIGGTTLAIEALRGGESPLRVAASTATALVRNPVILGVLTGIAWGATGLGLHPAVERFVTLLAGAAAPSALFALGASLAEFRIRGALAESLAMVGLKLLVLPALVWLLATFVFALPPLWRDVAVLCAAIPTGANVFLLGQRYGLYVRRSATAVLISTAVSIVTLSLLLTASPPP